MVVNIPLPKIRECPICKAALLSHVEALGKTANEAVFSPATCADEHDSDDETETEPEADEEDDDDNDEGQTETEIHENFVNSLINKTSLWRRPSLL